MELKINKNNKESRIDKTLGVSVERLEELKAIVNEQAEKVNDHPGITYLTQAYKVFAEKTNTLEEYTVCMHAFIFYISKIGGLASDQRFRN